MVRRVHPLPSQTPGHFIRRAIDAEHHTSVLVREAARSLVAVMRAMTTSPNSLALRFSEVLVLKAAVENFDATLRCKYAGIGSNPLRRLASTRRLALDLELRVHVELGTLIDAVLSADDDHGSWRDRIVAARLSEEDELSSQATQSSRVLADAARTAPRRFAAMLLEGIAMLRFELTVHNASHSQQHRNTMRRVLCSIEDSRLFGTDAASLRPLLRHDRLAGFIPRYSVELSGQSSNYGSLRHGTLLDASRIAEAGARIVVTQPFALPSIAALPEVIDSIAKWSSFEHDNIAKCLGFTFWNRDEVFTPCSGSDESRVDESSAERGSDGLLVATVWAVDSVSSTPICFGAPTSERETLATLLQVARALARLHQGDLAHQSICCENIIIRSDGRVQLANFQLGSTAAPRSSQSIDRMSAPESVLGRNGDGIGALLAADIYSLGLCATVMLTGELPFDTKSDQDVLEALMNREPITRPSRVSDALWRVLNPLLAADPASRPGIDAVIRNFRSSPR
jgi:serine/threonine protein kinase